MKRKLVSSFTLGTHNRYIKFYDPHFDCEMFNKGNHNLIVEVRELTDPEKDEKRKNLQDRINDLEAQAEGLRVEMEGL